MISKIALTTTLAAGLPLAAQAVTVGPGESVEAGGDTLRADNPTYSEIVTATDDVDLDFSMTYTGPLDALDAFTVGVADSPDFDQATTPLMPVGEPTGDLQEGVNTIAHLSVRKGESVYALFDSNGALGDDAANVGFSVDGEALTENGGNGGQPAPNPVPLPASALLLGGALAGFGAMRRKRG